MDASDSADAEIQEDFFGDSLRKKLLPDTHVLLWWIDNENIRIGPKTKAAITVPAMRFYVSAASTGKLPSSKVWGL
ncbi:MAG: hypothetical protein IPM37_12265 [Hahellaceae bacterium]|nr:hypothetical protein [Hahellaceae bacterium]